MKPIDVVSDTSPLIFLDKIDSIALLEKCFHRIYIPEGVKNEWRVKTIPDFISVHPVSGVGMGYVEGATGRLHKGELEAIQLAIELDCKVILMDDLVARHAAERRNLIPLGVLGVLKIACRLELLTRDEVKGKVNELINNHGLYISPNILQQYFTSL
jgi:predicted nucleic acid-binding protein